MTFAALRSCLLLCLCTFALPAQAAESFAIAGVPLEFILFGATLLGVALLHHHTLAVALTGLTAITLYKLVFTGFAGGTGLMGLGHHMAHEWVTLANLFCLLTGFTLLARHFEKSHLPVLLPRFLPHDWRGAFLLLVMVFVISAFLDNIAAALIGAAMAHQLFRARVHIGYLAGIVAASNAGGSGSVLGDTTTTMIWLAGVSPFEVVHAYVAAVVALLISGLIAARQQHAYEPMLKHTHTRVQLNWDRIGIVLALLLAAVSTNVWINTRHPGMASELPYIGLAVWVTLLITAPIRRHDWEVLPASIRGTIFLLALVTAASMMPVASLPAASWQTAFGLGFISAVFDNIPLTALALLQGGYDWGVLAYAVGFGGSMLWFGSSAGVAVANIFPEAKSAAQWLRHGWHVPVAYVAGFAVLMLLMGWHPALTGI